MQNTKPAPHEQIFSAVLGFWQARALAVATELGRSSWALLTQVWTGKELVRIRGDFTAYIGVNGVAG